MAEKTKKYVVTSTRANIDKIKERADSAKDIKVQGANGESVTRKVTIGAAIFNSHMKSRGFDTEALNDFGTGVKDYMHDIGVASSELLAEALEKGDKIDRVKIADPRNTVFNLATTVDAKTSRQKRGRDADNNFVALTNPDGSPMMEDTYGKITNTIGVKVRPDPEFYAPWSERIKQLVTSSDEE